VPTERVLVQAWTSPHIAAWLRERAERHDRSVVGELRHVLRSVIESSEAAVGTATSQ
jgi:plasmid stability protein